MSEGWREVAGAASRAQKLALPWASERGHELRRTGKVVEVVGEFRRVSALGKELALVASRTIYPPSPSAEELQRGVRKELSSSAYSVSMFGGAAKAADDLADAFATADAELEAQGYEVIGRVVWMQGSTER